MKNNNLVYDVIVDEDYLVHHGILGQKWYHKNGPPYPLDPKKDYSSIEKKLNNVSNKIKEKVDEKKENLKRREEYLKNTAQEKKKLYDYKKMSNDQLQQYINRANLEEQYVKKVTPELLPKKKSTFIKDTLSNLNKTVLGPAVSNIAKLAIVKMLEESDNFTLDDINVLRKAMNLPEIKKKGDGDDKHTMELVDKLRKGEIYLEDLDDKDFSTLSSLAIKLKTITGTEASKSWGIKSKYDDNSEINAKNLVDDILDDIGDNIFDWDLASEPGTSFNTHYNIDNNSISKNIKEAVKNAAESTVTNINENAKEAVDSAISNIAENTANEVFTYQNILSDDDFEMIKYFHEG